MAAKKQTQLQRRTFYPKAQKLEIIRESYKAQRRGEPVERVASKHDITVAMLFTWRKKFREILNEKNFDSDSAFTNALRTVTGSKGAEVIAVSAKNSRVIELEKENAELKSLIIELNKRLIRTERK